MKTKLSALAVIGAALVACTLQTTTSEWTPETDYIPNAWFVELEGEPAVDGLRTQAVQTQQARVQSAIRTQGVNFDVRRQYTRLFNGFAIDVSDSEIRKVAHIAGVKAVYPIARIDAPKTIKGEKPELDTSINMIGAPITQDTLGFKGTGIKVGVIDSGIDLQHPDFGNRIQYGYDFVGDAYDSGSPDPAKNTPVPNQDTPDDCGGHGTHVAGIVGANGFVKGVAPNVTLGAYRVFGCSGSSSSDVIISALEKAMADGMDIINMSLGASYQWPNYPTGVAIERMTQQGLIVVAAAGNNGGTGLFAIGAPGSNESTISVANVNNTTVLQSVVNVSGQNFGYLPAGGSSQLPTSGTALLARTGAPTVLNDACNAVKPPLDSLVGKIALVRRGTCTFAEKTANVIAAGAIGVVFYNNVITPEPFSGSVGTGVNIPTIFVSSTDGTNISSLLPNALTDTVNLTWTSVSTRVTIGSGGMANSSSSVGPAPDLSMKPDVSAPGGFIYSTYTNGTTSTYDTLSGTSMASPHVAGAVALILQKHPTLKGNARAIRQMLQNTSTPYTFRDGPTLGLDLVQRQGSGLINVTRALTAEAQVIPSRLPFGEVESSKTATLTVTNTATRAITYTLGHVAALAVGANTFTLTPITNNHSAAINFSAPNITITAGGTATFDITMEPNAALANGSMFSGFIQLVPDAGGVTLSVPYTGYKGDFQTIPVFGAISLSDADSTKVTTYPSGGTFTMVGINSPSVVLSLAIPVRQLDIELVSVDGSPVNAGANLMSRDDYIRRSTSATTPFRFIWNGTVNGGKNTEFTVLPNGEYKFLVQALRPGGDPDNVAHWATWTSPTFVVARP
jgi:minor extracellular serine protease Vpr